MARSQPPRSIRQASRVPPRYNVYNLDEFVLSTAHFLAAFFMSYSLSSSSSSSFGDGEVKTTIFYSVHLSASQSIPFPIHDASTSALPYRYLLLLDPDPIECIHTPQRAGRPSTPIECIYNRLHTAARGSFGFNTTVYTPQRAGASESHPVGCPNTSIQSSTPLFQAVAVRQLHYILVRKARSFQTSGD